MANLSSAICQMDTYSGGSILRNDALILAEFVPIPACVP